ncbi:MAG: 3-hydroxybutyrate dehydrogenase [Rhizobiaceae bacterium]|nr:3-hydroxybutyrate dehydrogenase [Rhizobiaceae bacterium]
MNSKPRTAIVTGSTSGIGLAIARRFAAEGCNVVFNSFSDTAEDHAVADKAARETGAKTLYVQADMSKGDQCRGLVAKAMEAFGSVDILVNNAGVQHVAAVEDFPPAKWDQIIAINLTSAFHTSAAAIPLMKAAGGGRIINIASAHGLVASPFKSAYVSAKHGIMGLTKTTALEVAQSGITCNAICPGYVLTPLVEAQIPDQMKAHDMDRETVIRDVMLDKQPTKEFVTVEQIAATAWFLCSADAAQINGTHISVDGGWTAE